MALWKYKINIFFLYSILIVKSNKNPKIEFFPNSVFSIFIFLDPI